VSCCSNLWKDPVHTRIKLILIKTETKKKNGKKDSLGRRPVSHIYSWGVRLINLRISRQKEWRKKKHTMRDHHGQGRLTTSDQNKHGQVVEKGKPGEKEGGDGFFI